MIERGVRVRSVSGLVVAALGIICSLTLTVEIGRADPPSPPAAPPAFTVLPVPALPPMPNEAVALDVGAVTGAATITVSCQWQSGGNGTDSATWSNISGATSCASFTPGTSLTGHWLRAEVTAQNSVGEAVIESLPMRIGGQLIVTKFESNSLWAYNSNGTNGHALLSGNSWDMKNPALSPLGDEILFSSNRNPAVANGTKSDYGIWVISADGSGEARLVADNSGNDIFPRWSPDGTRILYVNETDNGLYVANADGSANTKAYTFFQTHLNTFGTENGPEWAPDGQSIYFFDEFHTFFTGSEKVYLHGWYSSLPTPQYGKILVNPGTTCTNSSYTLFGFTYGGFGADMTCRQQLDLFQIDAHTFARAQVTDDAPVNPATWASKCGETPYGGYCRTFSHIRFLPGSPDTFIFANQGCPGIGGGTTGGTLVPHLFGSCRRMVGASFSPTGGQFAYFNGIAFDRYIGVTPSSSFSETLYAAGGMEVDWGLAVEVEPVVPLEQSCGVGEFAGDGGGRAGDNVHSGYGSYTRVESDLQMPAIDMPFTFARSYNSLCGGSGELGNGGWRTSWDAKLTVMGNGDVYAIAPSGQSVYFQKQTSGDFKPAGGAKDTTLTKLTSTYELEFNAKQKYLYNLSGKLLSISTRNGKTTTLGYDGSGRLTSITDTAGRTITVTRDATPSRIASVTLPDSRQVSFSYDGSGRLSTATDARGKTTTYEYEASGKLWRVTDPRGNYTVRNTYDASGRITQQQDALAKTTSFAWDAARRKATVTDANSKTTVDVYNTRMALRSRTDELGHKTQYRYNRNLNPVQTIDPLGNSWEATFDTRGNALSQVAPAPASTVETSSYDSQGNVLSATDGLERTTLYDYDAAGNLVETTKADGHVLTLTPNADGLVTESEDELGNVTHFTYDSAGNQLSVTTPEGRKTSSSYDATGHKLTTVSPRGNVSGCSCAADYTTTYTYNANDQLLTSTDPLGRVTTNTYDENGNLATLTNALNKTWSYTYNAANQKTAETGPGSVDTTYAYNDLGQLTSTTSELGRATTYTYTDNGKVATKVSPRGNVSGCGCAANYRTAYAYDANGNLTSVTLPLGQQTSFVYDEANRRIEATDADANTTEYEYDDAGNLATVTNPLNKTRSFSYDRLNRVVSVADERGKETLTAYDAAGRVIKRESELGRTTTFAYDADGRLLSSVDPRGNLLGCACATDFTTSYAYDADGHLTSTLSPLGRETTSAFDKAGQLTSATNARGETSEYEYDALGRMTLVTNALAGETAYAYDDYDHLVSATDPKTHATTSAYDADGFLTSVTKPGTSPRTWEFGYDADGNRIQVTDANGVATTGTATDGITDFSFDRNGRLTDIDYSDATPDVSLDYDDRGNLVEMVDGEGTESYEYDELNRLNEISRGSNTFSYGYDDASRLTSRTLPDATTISYGYDDDNRLTSATESSNTVSYGYDAAGNLTTTTLPSGNGYVETRSYDEDGLLSSLANANSTATLSSFALTRDENGNPTQVDALNNGSSWTEKYNYDELDRLTEVCYQSSCPGGSDPFIRWTYDEVGNRASEARPAGTTSYTYNAADQLTQRSGLGGTVNYSYDQVGNQLSAGSVDYSYSLANLVTSVDDNTNLVEYAYDGAGKRLRRIDNSITSTKYLWDPTTANATLALERDGANNPTRRYLYSAAGTFAFDDSSADFYYQHDWLGSVADVTGASGATEWAYTYEPFGLERSSTNVSSTAPANPLRFTGQYDEASTGLYHLRARDYDPTTGRFLGVDPVSPSLAAGTSSAYAYVGNRPTMLVDPSGMISCGPLGGLCGAIGTGAGYAGRGYMWAANTFIADPFRQAATCLYMTTRASCTATAINIASFGAGKLLGVGATALARSSVGARFGARFAPALRRLATEETGSFNFGGFRRAPSQLDGTSKTAIDAVENQPARGWMASHTRDVATEPNAIAPRLGRTQTDTAAAAEDTPQAVKFGGESDAAATGRAVHDKFDNQLRQLSQDDPRWQPGLRSGPNRPDGFFDGDPIELKPKTPSGLKAGVTQLNRYVGAFGAQRGYLYTYDANGVISLHRIITP